MIFASLSGDKRAWYTLFAHAQFPQDFGVFGNFHKNLLHYTKLGKAH